MERREKGDSFNKIAEFLNHSGFKTARGKMFRGAHIHSIVKKKAIRDERLNREFPLEIHGFSIEYY